MKLHRLELTGFGPFRETQVVDFDAFDADGIFLISGRTGAGKSSVLDGVCFALYGSVPRYDGPDRRLRSDHCLPEDPTEVLLDFTIADRRWRVRRSPEFTRPKRRGDGLTTEPPRAELLELVGDTWIGRAARPRDVAETLDELLGLTLQQFQQVILLAQNRFSRFLLAASAERQSLLRTLFGTRRHEEYAAAIDARRKATQQLVRERGAGAEALLAEAERLIAEEVPDGADSFAAGRDDAVAAAGSAGEAVADLAARRQAVEAARVRAAYRAEAREQERRAAQAAAERASAEQARLTALRAAQVARDEASARLSQLDAAAGDVARDRGRHARAVAAERLRAEIDAASRATAAARAAEESHEIARQAWVDAGEEIEIDLDRLDDELTGELARWQEALTAERELAAVDGEAEQVDGEIAEHVEALAALDERRSGLPARIEAIDAELATARARAAGYDAARAARHSATERLEGAREAAALEPRARAAEAAHVAAAEEASRAGEAFTRMLRRRLAGRAGELAAELEDGEPCAVCGSTEHPRPAAPGDDPVTDEAVARAEDDRDTALEAERTAAAAVRAVRDEIASCAARSGGRGVEPLEAELEAAEAALGEADSARRRSAELADERARLIAADAAGAAEREALAAEAARCRERAAALAATTERLRRTVVEARGDHASVEERIAAGLARRGRARALRDASRERASADADARRARAEMDERIAISEFATVESVREALLDADVVERLHERVAEHDREVAMLRARLLELQLELAGAPEEPIDLAAAEAARVDADRAREAATSALIRAETTAERLTGLAHRIDGAFADVERLDEDAAVVARLADTLQGRAPNTRRMTLETFVLAAELEEIVTAANVRLQEMSSGRYTLHHSDSLVARGAASGLGIEVMDAHTGRSRPAASLSGGETFLASLALALGLAEVVTSRAGGLRLDTLFVDEGFGSLDGETLELAMRTLDELRAGGRTVGVISHVEAMKDQLPARVIVEATPQGPSVIARS